METSPILCVYSIPSSANSGGMYHQDAEQASTTLQEPHCAGIPSRNTGSGWHLENHSLEETMPKSHSKGGESGHVGHGSPCIQSPTKGSHYHMRGAKLPWVGGRGTTCSSAIMVRRIKASEADSSWKANSEGNGQETGSAALREGTVRRGKERPLPPFLK